MRPYGFYCVLICPYKSLRPYRSIWVLIGRFESLWVLMGPYAS